MVATSQATRVKKQRKVINNADVPVTEDHRKRRRNRTTQSCLNCHGSKRMCDRKRPACGRCVKLGLSGLCVYEVDDPNQKKSDKNQSVQLKNRIAELEGFIREFKKKPHPRHASNLHSFRSTPTSSECREISSPFDPTEDETHRHSPGVATTEGCSTPVSENSELSVDLTASSAPTTPPTHDDTPILLTPPGDTLLSLSLASDRLSSSSAISKPVSVMDDTSDIASHLYPRHVERPEIDDIFEDMFMHILRCDAKQGLEASPVQACECMNKTTAYAAVIELAPHLRKALNALRTLPEHEPQLRFACDLFQRLEDLCASTSNAIDRVSSSLAATDALLSCASNPRPHSRMSSFPPSPRMDHESSHAWLSTVASSTISLTPAQPANSHPCSGNPVYTAQPDRLMTWEPPSTADVVEWPLTGLL